MSEPTPLTATNAARAMTLLVMASRVDPNLRSAVADVESHVAELQREIEGYRHALITAQIAYHNLGEHRGLPERCDIYLCRRWNEMTAARAHPTAKEQVQ